MRNIKKGVYTCGTHYHYTVVVYSMEWSLGAEFWSGVLEWSGVKLLWSGKRTCSLLIKLCILWSGVLELSIGVDWSQIWRSKSRMECSCDVCVCVCGPVLCNLVIVMDQ